ncbi:hypothetical protein [Bacillus phage MrBubbles]|nr:hypothetical protein [Bacillus phage MrBubbles]
MVNKENATIILNNFFMFPIMEETIYKTQTNPVIPRVHKGFKINKKSLTELSDSFELPLLGLVGAILVPVSY